MTVINRASVSAYNVRYMFDIATFWTTTSL